MYCEIHKKNHNIRNSASIVLRAFMAGEGQIVTSHGIENRCIKEILDEQKV